MNRLAKQCAALVIAGLFLVCGSIATAQVIIPFDAKVHHSSECQPTSHGFSSSLVYDPRGLLNNGGSLVGVTCPIVRDNATNTTGTNYVEIAVTNVAPQQLACILYSHDTHDVLVAQSTASTVAGGKRTLRMYVTNGVLIGHYSLKCGLPSGAKLHSYTVKEWLGSGTDRTDYRN